MVVIAKPNDDPYSINEPKFESTIQGTIYEIKSIKGMENGKENGKENGRRNLDSVWIWVNSIHSDWWFIKRFCVCFNSISKKERHWFTGEEENDCPHICEERSEFWKS